jgi:ribonuclease BN (tRNA processing enzyme)
MTKGLVQVRFVGSGDAFGSGGRFQTCILLRAPGHNGDVLLDCGASSLIALKQQRQDPNQIGLVLVSHLHGDHFGGLPFLVLDGQFAHRTRPLHVVGPAGVGERVQAAMEVLFPGSTQIQRRFPVHFHELIDRQPLRFDAGSHHRLHRRHRVDRGAGGVGAGSRPVDRRGLHLPAQDPIPPGCGELAAERRPAGRPPGDPHPPVP